MKLHHVGATPSRRSFDVGGTAGVRWRGEKSSDGDDLREEMAYRLAVAWNLVRGWTTEFLMSGAFARQDELTRALLKTEPYSEQQQVALNALRDHMSMRDANYDSSWEET